jgi:outer membrane protein, heavy metal efflux system
MNRCTLCLIVAVTLCGSPPVRANGASLASLVQELLTNNPELKHLTAEISAARARIPQASALDDPRLGIEASNITTGNVSLQRTPMSGWQISLRQHVPFPGKLRTKKHIARARHSQATQEKLERVNHLVAKFKVAFYEYAYVAQAVRITHQTAARLRALIVTLEAKYAADQVPQQDVLKTKLELSRVREQLILYRSQRKQLGARLATLLSRPIETSLRVALPRQRLSAVASDLASLQTYATTQRPWLAKATAHIRESAQTHRLAKKGLLPDFDFSAGYRVRDNQITEPIGGTNFFSAGVQMTIPLWGLKKQRNHIRETRHALHAAREDKAALADEVRYQVADIYYGIQQARAQYQLLRRHIVPEARAALAASRTSYEAGAVDYLNVITNELSLFSSQLQLYRHFYSHEQRVAQLEMATGRSAHEMF